MSKGRIDEVQQFFSEKGRMSNKIYAGGGHGTPAKYGHVAFVEKVYLDGSFLIFETNYNGNPNYAFRRLSEVDSSLSFAYTMK